MAPVRLPADVELEDRLAFGLTGKQLALLAATAISAYGCFLLLSSLLPAALAAAAPLLLLAGGAFLVLLRRDGMSGDQLALALIRFTVAAKRQVLTPEQPPAALPAAPPVPRLSPLDIPIRRILTSGLVELSDGSSCLLLRAQGASFELRSPDEQAAYVAAFARFLNALSSAVQICVRSEPASLQTHANTITEAATSLPPRLRNAALEHARFLSSLGRERPLWRRAIVLVLHARGQQAEGAEVTLSRLAGEATELLAGAQVALRSLDGEQAAALLAASLDPPGPVEGSHLTGEIHAQPAPPQTNNRQPPITLGGVARAGGA